MTGVYVQINVMNEMTFYCVSSARNKTCKKEISTRRVYKISGILYFKRNKYNLFMLKLNAATSTDDV